MKFNGYSFTSDFRFVLICGFVAVIGISLSVSVAGAEKDKADVGVNATEKLNLDKLGVQVGASGNISAKAEENTSSSSNGKPQEAYHENTQAETHEHFKTSYEKMSVDSDNTFTVQTERHLYKPGDRVELDGTIWSGLIAAVGGINTVSIQVTDNDNNVVYSGKQDISSGQYSASFDLPSDAKKGAYTAEIKADVNADVLNSLTLKMQAGLDSKTKFVVVSQNAWAVKAEGKDFDVDISTNSNVSDLKFDQQAKKLSLTVQGESGTTGVADITIPKSLLSGDLTVMIDGQVVAGNDVIVTSDTQDQTTLEINYHHSSHVMDIVGTSAVPEFPASMIIMTAALSAMIVLIPLANRAFKRNSIA